MKHKIILILGDSTSMTVGMERETYPFHLSAMRMWASGTKIVNCSLPGFTSADACAFFFRKKKHIEPIAALIVYLGNCDAISSELRKGRYSFFRQSKDCISAVHNKKSARVRLKNRLLHFKWNNNCDSAVESPENPKDYQFNISRIVSYSQKHSIPVILIRPQAHVLFPAGVGKGNFIFYKYLGIHDRIADQISIEDERFREALRLHEGREFKQAMEMYKAILFKSGPLSLNLEYQGIVVNNYAVCAAETNAFDEAEYLLSLLLKEKGVRKEIILFNLAQLSRLKGNAEEYKGRLIQAYEADKSMYRVRNPYKCVIDKVAAKYPNVNVVDLKDFVSDDDYVDHCHPVAKAQILIARQIVEKLRTVELVGDQPLAIENQLYNPEFALGNTADFHTYFKTFSAFSPDEIKNHISAFKLLIADKKAFDSEPDSPPEGAPAEISTAVAYYLKHPCFPKAQDALIACPFLPSDVGRFPEYFLFRYLIPYLSIVEETQELARLFSPQSGLLRRAQDFASVLPEPVVCGTDAGVLKFDPEYERIRLPAILQKVSVSLLKHLRQGHKIYERLKTTIYWYFRETLRFGAHSRVSMRYERISLEYMIEALAVAAVLDFRLGGKMRFEIQRLIEWVEETAQVHELFCSAFSLEKDNQAHLDQYNSKLMDIARDIEASFRLFSTSETTESGRCIS